MDGRAFLQVAREVFRGRTEAHWHSAAGRAYYALMLECRAALQRWGFQVPHGPGVHNFVRLRFSRTGDADLQAISDDLDWMCRVRNYADYEIPVSLSFANDIRQERLLLVPLMPLIYSTPSKLPPPGERQR